MLTPRGPTKADILLLATTDFIGATTLTAALYGFSFAFYCLTTQIIYGQLKSDPNRRKQSFGTLAIMSYIMACGFIILAIQIQGNKIQYIDHGHYPWSKGGPFAYASDASMDRLPMTFVLNTFHVSLNCLTFGIPIWRLWVIWNISRYAAYVVAPTILLFLANIALTIAGIVLRRSASDTIDLPLEISGLSLEVPTHMMTTAFIIGRIVCIRRRHVKLMGQSDNARQYTSIIAMLIESYALDAAWTLAQMISFIVGLESPPQSKIQNHSMATFNLLAGSQDSIRILAYILVVYRVTVGRGWSRQTERQLTSLQFDRDLQNTTTGTIVPGALPESHV